MQAMLDEVAPKLKIGVRMFSETVRADAREGDIGMQLGEIAKAHPGVAIGSYPFFDPQHGPNMNVVVRASLLVIGLGIFRFVNRRHPRVLARIPPTQLGLWSLAVAIAHGAGLMLVLIYLGLCRAADLDKGHEAASALINANLGMAVLVSLVHSIAMIVAGGLLAWLVYRYLGLWFVSRSWFNLDATWAFSLILVGALSLAISLASRQ
jgi:hypothetical protein